LSKVLETESLILRHLTDGDGEFMLKLLNEPSFIANIADRGVRTVEQAQQYVANGPGASYVNNGFGLYAVELKNTSEIIGVCGLIKREGLDDPDIGYAYLPAYWSKGYAYEAASAVIDYEKKTLGLKRVVAIVSPHNKASIRVLEKAGLRYEGMITLPRDGDPVMFFVPEEA
jgi:RimJ/RimL family protein N-acetyltransferase